MAREGWREALDHFKSIKKLGVRPGHVMTSEADRARETAVVFCNVFGRKLHTEPRLNPGCTMASFRGLLRDNKSKKALVVVGHEPDFSRIIAAMIGGKGARIKMAKSACAMVSLGEKGAGKLLWLLPPARRMRKTS